jgi:hypothetical protein
MHVRVSAAQTLEMKMTTVKGLAIVALLVGGTSLAIAQNGPATGGQPPVAGGAAGNPAAPGPNLQTGARAHHGTRHHRNMYMQGNVHHGSKHTGTALSHQKFMNNQNSYR